MVNMIKKDARLVPYLKTDVEDSGARVEISDNLSEDDFAAIKVDEYYAGVMPGQEPKAVDYVVVVDCSCDAFFMYILEMKNVNSPKHIIIKDIYEKFYNTIHLFLSDDFAEIFLNDRFKYKGVKLYLVSDAYRQSGRFSTHEEFIRYRERINKKDSLSVDMKLSSKPLKFRGKLYNIEYDMPPNPVIKKWTS